MKRFLIVTVMLIFVLGFFGTAFAATVMPDYVPADHWAYTAIKELARAGIIDGYADGKFRGDKPMTRYEMGKIVEKVIENPQKIDAKHKALIDKLAIEFAMEINDLSTHLNSEKQKQEAVQMHGEIDIRSNSKDFEVPSNKSTNSQERFRLDASFKLDDYSTAGIRVVNDNTYQTTQNTKGFGLPASNSWTKFGNDGTAQTSINVDRYWINRMVGTTKVTIGRQMLSVGTSGSIVDSGVFSFDGVSLVTQLGQVRNVTQYGRLPGIVNSATTDANNQKDIVSSEFTTAFGNFSSFGVGYFQIRDNAAVPVNTFDSREILDLYYGNFRYNFGPKASMDAEFGKNNASYATSHNTFYYARMTYGDQILNKSGKQDFQLYYYNVGRWALALDSSGQGLRTFGEGVGFGNGTAFNLVVPTYNYAFSSNLLASLQYFMARSEDATQNYKLWRCTVVAKF